MNLFFLPPKIRGALDNLNYNFLTEIRLRCGQPVILEYNGEYKYVNGYGVSDDLARAIVCDDVEKVLVSAMEKSVYAYTEQLKRGFVTVGGGIRMGVCGEYVTQGEQILAVKNVTSLNIRIPHEVVGAADDLYTKTCNDGVHSVLLFSPPGYGKTTILRDFARNLSQKTKLNVLVFDERNEISAMTDSGAGYDLGANCDVIRGADKLTAFSCAIRAMKPNVIITDELYGDNDFNAVRYAADCGIAVIASSHTVDREKLKVLPFDSYIELSGVGRRADIYDKNFNFVCDCSTVGSIRTGNFR